MDLLTTKTFALEALASGVAEQPEHRPSLVKLAENIEGKQSLPRQKCIAVGPVLE